MATIELHDHVIHPLATAGYSGTHLRGTVTGDHRNEDGTGMLTVRIDHTVTWQGERRWDRPRDFHRGHEIIVAAEDLTKDDVCVAGNRFAEAQIAAARLLAPAREALRTAVAAARAEGLPEQEIARRAHTTRTTVRDLQGKRR